MHSASKCYSYLQCVQVAKECGARPVSSGFKSNKEVKIVSSALPHSRFQKVSESLADQNMSDIFPHRTREKSEKSWLSIASYLL